MSGHRVRPGGQDTAVFTVGGSRQDYTLEQAKHLLQRKDEGLTQVSSRRANAILNMAEVNNTLLTLSLSPIRTSTVE